MNNQFINESIREFNNIWLVFKKDPLEPWRMYERNFVHTGMGGFVEGWVLFSIGKTFSSTLPNLADELLKGTSRASSPQHGLIAGLGDTMFHHPIQFAAR
jgi:hypothetical protein